MTDRVAIILAAGVSSRMNPVGKTLSPNGVKADTPKVLAEVCGRPMLAYVLDAVRQVSVKKIYVVVGFGTEKVKARFAADDDIVWIEQAEQKGTAHAVLCCKEYLADFTGETLILCGDGPLIRAEVLRRLIETHNCNTAATLATAELEEPAGYGRIVRDEDGDIKAIVEHNDCTDEQLRIRQVNPSYYLFDNKILFEALEKVRPDNKKGEYYLTDAVSIMIEAGRKVSAVAALAPEEAMSVNTPRQLVELNEIMAKRVGQSQSKG